MKDVFDKCYSDGGYFGEFRLHDDHNFCFPILDPKPGRISKDADGIERIHWSYNNYLGLAENEEIKAVALETLKKYGTSAPMGSRVMTGTTPRHLELEKSFAEYLEKESAILFNFGYLGVLGTLQAIVGKDDTIVIDKNSHASMIDGAFLAQGKLRVYRHNDMESLEAHLKRINRDRKGGVLIVTEGLFGMEGDLAYLPGICELKEKYDARLFIDDAHGFGVMGEEGQGTASYYGLQDKLDIYFGTFAKAFAGIGGVAAADKKVIQWMHYNARTQFFAKSFPIVYVEAIAKTLEIIRTDKVRRKRMWDNARKLKDGLSNLGYIVGDNPTPICPVYVPIEHVEIGLKIIQIMREMGIFITGMMHPVVPKGIALYRMIPTASHTDEDIDYTVNAFKKVRDDLKLNLTVAKKAVG
jgi:glycine C-acetyltransferase